MTGEYITLGFVILGCLVFLVIFNWRNIRRKP
jgi:hypothetical protein